MNIQKILQKNTQCLKKRCNCERCTQRKATYKLKKKIENCPNILNHWPLHMKQLFQQNQKDFLYYYKELEADMEQIVEGYSNLLKMNHFKQLKIIKAYEEAKIFKNNV